MPSMFYTGGRGEQFRRTERNTDDEGQTKTYLTRSSWRRCLYAGCDVCVDNGRL